MYCLSELSLTTKVMLEGLKSHASQLAGWGFDGDFLAELNQIYQEMLRLSGEQKALMSRQKEKTSAVNEKAVAVDRLCRKARHLVKAQLPQESWKEFGIRATR